MGRKGEGERILRQDLSIQFKGATADRYTRPDLRSFRLQLTQCELMSWPVVRKCAVFLLIVR
jgi:hypothetical protein